VVEVSLGTVDPKTWVRIPAPACNCSAPGGRKS